MSAAFAVQMQKLSEARRRHSLTVETMGTTGRRFKKAFHVTPTQAQVMLRDPFDKEPPERTIWYQSRFYRANLHLRGDFFYIRDLHVYSDDFPQPFLTEPVTTHGIEQRQLAVMDGYHWSDDAVRSRRPGKRAMGKFVLTSHDQKQRFPTASTVPSVNEDGSILTARIPLNEGEFLVCVFGEREIHIYIQGQAVSASLALILEWVTDRSSFVSCSINELRYRFRSCNYSVKLLEGTAHTTEDGVRLTSGQKGLRLLMAQTL